MKGAGQFIITMVSGCIRIPVKKLPGGERVGGAEGCRRRMDMMRVLDICRGKTVCVVAMGCGVAVLIWSELLWR